MEILGCKIVVGMDSEVNEENEPVELQEAI